MIGPGLKILEICLPLFLLFDLSELLFNVFVKNELFYDVLTLV